MRAPYYDRDGFTLYCGDGLDFYESLGHSLTSKMVVLTDPMYNVGFDFGPGLDDSLDPEAYEARCRHWFDLFTGGGSRLAFTPGPTNPEMWYRRIAAPERVAGWFKPGTTTRWTYEPVFCYGCADAFDRWPNGFRADPDLDDDRIDWHPCPKPYKLALEMLLRTVPSPDWIVYDPFAGSGTVPVVARLLGLRAYASEVRLPYCRGIVERWESLDEDLLLSELLRGVPWFKGYQAQRREQLYGG